MSRVGLGVPLYHQITQVLRQRLTSGLLDNGAKLPTEARLCAEFNVSRTTIRQALEPLKAAGMLTSRRGVGTHGLSPSAPKRLVRSSGDPLHGGFKSRPRVISLARVAAPAPVAEFFGLTPSAEVFRVVRVHDLDGLPLSVVASYVKIEVGKMLTRASLRTSSMHELFWQRLGLRQKRSVHTIRVARADAEVADLLKIALADPVLRIQSSVSLENGAPIRWTENHFREDRYEYSAELLWPDPAQLSNSIAVPCPLNTSDTGATKEADVASSKGKKRAHLPDPARHRPRHLKII